VSAEAARVAGMVGALGLAVLLVAPRPSWRFFGLVALALGGGGLAWYLAPSGGRALLALPVLAVVAGLLAVLLRRWPWLLPVGALACAPVRIPIELGNEDANLLLPLYGLVVAAALALAWDLFRGDGRSRELGPLSWPLALFVLWSGISLLWTDDLREGGIALLAFYLPFGLLSLCLARLAWSRRWLGVVYVELVALATVFALIGIYQWLTRDVFWNPKVIVGNAYAPFYRVNSVFWDPSIYGRFLVVAILAALVVVLYGKTGRGALLSGLAIVAIWIGLVFSFSQSSFAALLVGVLGATVLAWRWRAVGALALAAAVVVAAGFAAPGVRDQFQSGFDKATSGRSSLASNGLRIARDNPAGGVGLGGFKRAYARETGLRGRDPKKAASHNTPITVTAELGLPGIALFVWLVFAALALPLRRASRSFAGRASLIFGLVLIAILVHSLFYNAFFEDPLMWGALGLAGLAFAWRTSSLREEEPA
jgi:putative inorganic carbon (HCO3(-)) transporter